MNRVLEVHGFNRYGLRKSEILRGRERFKTIALKGKRLDGHLLRCSYLIYNDGDAPLQVGIKVPATARGSSIKLNAARRNRLRRLMREAFSLEISRMRSSLVNSSACVGVIVSYKGAKSAIVARISLAQIHQDVQTFCSVIVSAARLNAQ